MIWSSFCIHPLSLISRCLERREQQCEVMICSRRLRYCRSSYVDGSVWVLASDLYVASYRLYRLYRVLCSIPLLFQRIMAILILKIKPPSPITLLNHQPQRQDFYCCWKEGLQFLLQLTIMSQQIDGFLQMGSSYNFQRQKLDSLRSKTIESKGFHKWTQDNMYKSSYAHFHSKDSLEPKNTVVPGYGGYIPSIKAENIHARGYSAMAKQSFQNERLGRNSFGLASTGFNLNKDVLIDTSKVASSSKYGKTEIQRAHPGWNADWKSTTHESFKPPAALLNPTYRQTDKWVETKKADTKGSGYSTNHAYLDGKGWHPDPILKGDNHRSEYRDRLNADHPFHRDPHVSKLAQLGKKQLNYRFN